MTNASTPSEDAVESLKKKGISATLDGLPIIGGAKLLVEGAVGKTMDKFPLHPIERALYVTSGVSNLGAWALGSKAVLEVASGFIADSTLQSVSSTVDEAIGFGTLNGVSWWTYGLGKARQLGKIGQTGFQVLPERVQTSVRTTLKRLIEEE